MTKLSTKHVKIVGMSACVPQESEENISLPLFASEEDARKVILSTGIERHRKAAKGTTASDLSIKAVTKLLTDLEWPIEEIDCLFYVCTSRDFIAPQTSCILQAKLGLREDCFVMDLPLGCAGWVYGMSVATAMMQNGTFKRGLLIAAETNTQNRNQNDRSVRPLFGDAATVTALEFNQDFTHPYNFVFGVDGTGANAIYMPYGGTRNPTTKESLSEVEIEPGIIRKGTDMIVNGMDVFGFAIKRPALSIKELISSFEINLDTIDYLFLHQANKYIDEKIRKSLRIPAEKVPYSLHDYGNVTCASIPLTIVTQCRDNIFRNDNHCIACGFGVGLSWSSMEFHFGPIHMPFIIEY